MPGQPLGCTDAGTEQNDEHHTDLKSRIVQRSIADQSRLAAPNESLSLESLLECIGNQRPPCNSERLFVSQGDIRSECRGTSRRHVRGG
jgi:hypothetical protein